MALAGFIGATPMRAPDVGTGANQVPTNNILGRLATQDVATLVATKRPGDTAEMSFFDVQFEYLSDTQIVIRMKGLDHVVRGVTLTLS